MNRLFAAVLLAVVCALPAATQESPPKRPSLADRTIEFQRVVTSARGLEFKTKVTVGEYSREELLAFLKKEMLKEFPPEDVEKYRQALVHFGLIAGDIDLEKTILDLLTSSIAGFYHPESKELRLIKAGEAGPGSDPLEEDVTLVHELCHAAQDQNFDLNTLPMEIKTNDDLVLAVQGLVEGDATVVGLKWGLKDQFEAVSRMVFASYKSGELGSDVKTPACLRRMLGFPYGYGSEFVIALLGKAKDDWTAVSKAFNDLPSSSEQIMHPKKYFQANRDYPQDISIDGIEAIVGDGWKLALHNVNGEFGTLLVLDEFKVETSRLRKAAAEGWDGDRYFIFKDAKGGSAGVWMTVWDSEDDAKEFYDAYAQVLTAKHEGAEQTKADQAVTLKKGALRTVMERRGAEVLVVDGFDEGPAGRINKIWSAVKKSEIKKVDRVEPKKK